LHRKNSAVSSARKADSAGAKQGEIKFADGDELIVCAFAVQKPPSERSGKKAQYEKAKKYSKKSKYPPVFLFFTIQKVRLRKIRKKAAFLQKKPEKY